MTWLSFGKKNGCPTDGQRAAERVASLFFRIPAWRESSNPKSARTAYLGAIVPEKRIVS
jgi:hypothetical protein